jgi:hypothetical protein
VQRGLRGREGPARLQERQRREARRDADDVRDHDRGDGRRALRHRLLSEVVDDVAEDDQHEREEAHGADSTQRGRVDERSVSARRVVLREQRALHRFDRDVDDLDVDLLDPIGGLRERHDDRHVDERLGLAAALAEQADGRDALLLRGLDRVQDVGRVAAGRDREQEVALLPVRLDRAREHRVEAEVVRHAGELARVAERDRRERRAVLAEAPGELLGEVHRVAHAAAVAAAHEQPAAPERLGRRFGEALHRRDVLRVGQEGVERGARLFERGADRIGVGHGVEGRGPAPESTVPVFVGIRPEMEPDILECVVGVIDVLQFYICGETMFRVVKCDVYFVVDFLLKITFWRL